MADKKTEALRKGMSRKGGSITIDPETGKEVRPVQEKPKLKTLKGGTK